MLKTIPGLVALSSFAQFPSGLRFEWSKQALASDKRTVQGNYPEISQEEYAKQDPHQVNLAASSKQGRAGWWDPNAPSQSPTGRDGPYGPTNTPDQQVPPGPQRYAYVGCIYSKAFNSVQASGLTANYPYRPTQPPSAYYTTGVFRCAELTTNGTVFNFAPSPSTGHLVVQGPSGNPFGIEDCRDQCVADGYELFGFSTPYGGCSCSALWNEDADGNGNAAHDIRHCRGPRCECTTWAEYNASRDGTSVVTPDEQCCTVFNDGQLAGAEAVKLDIGTYCPGAIYRSAFYSTVVDESAINNGNDGNNGNAGAHGDPHLDSLGGERFDIKQAGRYTILNRTAT